MAAATRSDAEGGHDAHVGELLWQLALLLSQPVILHGPGATGPRPDLVDIVVLDIRIVLLPSCRHVDEIVLIIDPAERAGRSGLALIVFSLMPEHGTDSVREFRLLQAP